VQSIAELSGPDKFRLRLREVNSIRKGSPGGTGAGREVRIWEGPESARREVDALIAKGPVQAIQLAVLRGFARLNVYSHA
jgi:hypothetical protein